MNTEISHITIEASWCVISPGCRCKYICIMNSHKIKVTTAGLNKVEAETTRISFLSYFEKCIRYYA